MQKDQFATEPWWISEELSSQLTSLRDAVGEAFGWSDPKWFTETVKLDEAFDFVQSNQPTLLNDVDDAIDDERRQRWLESVAHLKSPPQVSEVEQVDDTSVVGASTEPQTQPRVEAALPSIAHLSAMEQTLLEGALEKNSVEAAVRQIYDNMHKKTGWKYAAGAMNTDGRNLITGATNTGMCESYRNAFSDILKCYDTLRKAHPVEALRTAALNIEKDNSLNNAKFCTREGLTLMGGCKGNVYLEVDGKGAITARGANAINKFVFSGHWSLKVNGVAYDPIFYSIGEDNMGVRLNGRYEVNGGRYLVNRNLPTENQEFGSTFIWVSDFEALKSTVESMKQLYTDNKTEVDSIVSGDLPPKQGAGRKTERKVYADAKKLLENNVSNISIFEKVVDDTKETIFRPSDAEAVKKILAMATK